MTLFCKITIEKVIKKAKCLQNHSKKKRSCLAGDEFTTEFAVQWRKDREKFAKISGCNQEEKRINSLNGF